MPTVRAARARGARGGSDDRRSRCSTKRSGSGATSRCRISCSGRGGARRGSARGATRGGARGADRTSARARARRRTGRGAARPRPPLPAPRAPAAPADARPLPLGTASGCARGLSRRPRRTRGGARPRAQRDPARARAPHPRSTRLARSAGRERRSTAGGDVRSRLGRAASGRHARLRWRPRRAAGGRRGRGGARRAVERARGQRGRPLRRDGRAAAGGRPLRPLRCRRRCTRTTRSGRCVPRSPAARRSRARSSASGPGIAFDDALLRRHGSSLEFAAASRRPRRASRSSASPDTIVTTDRVRRATAHAVEFRAARGPRKGMPRWCGRWCRRHSNPGWSVLRSGRAAFVGRKRELEALTRAVARTRDARTPQIVTLIGAAGHRQEPARARAETQATAGGRVARGALGPYGDGLAFWPLAQIVKARAGILDSDGPRRASEKLHAAVRAARRRQPDWIAEQLERLVAARAADAIGARPGRGVRGVVAVHRSRRARRTRSCSSSRICTGPTKGRWTSSPTSVRPSSTRRCSCCAPRGPSSWSAGPRWGGGAREATSIALDPLATADVARAGRPRCWAARRRTSWLRWLLERVGGNPLFAGEFAACWSTARRWSATSTARGDCATTAPRGCSPTPSRGSSPPASTRWRPSRGRCCATRRSSARSSGPMPSPRSTAARASWSRRCAASRAATSSRARPARGSQDRSSTRSSTR